MMRLGTKRLPKEPASGRLAVPALATHLRLGTMTDVSENEPRYETRSDPPY